MTNVRFTDQPDGWTKVSFPYDPALVAIVKGLSPGRRAYDPKTKSWLVLTDIAEDLAAVMIVSGHTVGDEPPPKTLEDFFAGIDTTADGFDAKAVAAEFIASLPGQHVGKVFRMMARQLYPDLYGGKR